LQSWNRSLILFSLVWEVIGNLNNGEEWWDCVVKVLLWLLKKTEWRKARYLLTAGNLVASLVPWAPGSFSLFTVGRFLVSNSAGSGFCTQEDSPVSNLPHSHPSLLVSTRWSPVFPPLCLALNVLKVWHPLVVLGGRNPLYIRLREFLLAQLRILRTLLPSFPSEELSLLSQNSRWEHVISAVCFRKKMGRRP
jgi:hypothetical protein